MPDMCVFNFTLLMTAACMHPPITWRIAMNSIISRHAMVRDGLGVVSWKAVTLLSTLMLLL